MAAGPPPAPRLVFARWLAAVSFRCFAGAAHSLESAYRLLLHWQPDGTRYHKGQSLHNWGLTLLWDGNPRRGREEALAAFVEDAASLPEEKPQLEALDRVAAATTTAADSGA